METFEQYATKTLATAQTFGIIQTLRSPRSTKLVRVTVAAGKRISKLESNLSVIEGRKEMKLMTEKIRGVAFDIEVDSQGQFFCNMEGENIKAHTLDLLRKKLAQAQKRKHANIAIPFTFFENNWRDDEGTLRKGIAVGIHASNGNPLVKLDGGQSVEQWSSYRRSEAYPVEHGAELARLYKAVKTADEALEAFKQKYRFNVAQAVKDALGEKTVED